MSSPLVSVILATYNRAYILEESLNSVLNQTYENFELLVIDDGSTDSTAELVQSFRDDRIRYHRLSENQGVPVAQNAGLKEASGDYIAFQDSDDLWLPSKLEKMLNRFDKLSEDTGLIYCGSFVEHDSSYRPLLDRNKFEGDLYKETMLRNIVFPSHPLIRKDCLQKTGLLDEDLPDVEDSDFLIRFTRQFDVGFVPDVLNIYRKQTDSTVEDRSAKITGRKKLARKHYHEMKTIRDQRLEEALEMLEKSSKNRPCLIWGTGHAGQASFQALEDRGIEVDGFISPQPQSETLLERPVLAIAALLSRYPPTSPPFILVESIFVNEIKPLMDRLGYDEQADYALNTFSKLFCYNAEYLDHVEISE